MYFIIYRSIYPPIYQLERISMCEGVIYSIDYIRILHRSPPFRATRRSRGQPTTMWHTLSTPTLNCAGLRRVPPFARPKSPCRSVNVGMGLLEMSGNATPPIPGNAHDTSRELHGIGWVGPPSHFSEVGFFGEAIEPSRKPFFRTFTCDFLVCVGLRVEAKLVDTFTLLLTSDLTGTMKYL